MTAEEKLLELLEIQDKLDQIIKERNQLMDNADIDVSDGHFKYKLDPYEKEIYHELIQEDINLCNEKDKFIKTHNVDNDFALAKAEYKRLRAPIDELEIQAEKIKLDDHNLRSSNQDSAYSIQNLSSKYKSISHHFIAAVVLLSGACVHTFLVGSSSKVVLLLSALLAALFIPLSIVAAKQSSKLKRKSQRISNRPYSNDFFLKENYEKCKTISDEITAQEAPIFSELAHLAWMLEMYEKVYHVKKEDSILKLENRKKIPQYTPDSPQVKDLQKLHTGKTFSNISVVAIVIAAIMNLVPIGIAGTFIFGKGAVFGGFIWSSAAILSAFVAIAVAITGSKSDGSKIGTLVGGFFISLIPAAIVVIIAIVLVNAVNALTGNPLIENFNKEQIDALEITSVEKDYTGTFDLTEEGTLYWEFYGKVKYWESGNNNDFKSGAQDIIEISGEKQYYTDTEQPTRVTWSNGTATQEANTPYSGVYGPKLTAKIATDEVSQIKILVGMCSWSSYKVDYQMTVFDENGNIIETAILKENEKLTTTMFTFDLSDYEGNEISITFESLDPENYEILINSIAVS